MQHRGHGGHHGVTAEGALPGCHLVQHRPEGKDVAAGVHLVAFGLLGRRVRRRAHEDAVLGLELHFAGGIVGCDGSLHELGEAEIQHLDDAIRGDHDVARLQVAVDDARGVSLGHGGGDGYGVLEAVGGGEAVCRDHLIERPARQIFHGDVHEAILLADIVDGYGVGVVESRGGPCFADEALAPIGIARHFGPQHLERDLPIEACIARPVDVAHTARTDSRSDAVRPKLCARLDRCRMETLASIGPVGSGAHDLYPRTLHA